MASKANVESIVASLSAADIESIENAWAIGRLDYGNEHAARDHITQVKRRSEKAIPLLKRMERDLESLAKLHRSDGIDEKTLQPTTTQHHQEWFERYKGSLAGFSMAAKVATQRSIPRGATTKAAMLRPLIHAVAKIAKRHNIEPKARGVFADLLNEIGKRHLPLWSQVDYRTLGQALRK